MNRRDRQALFEWENEDPETRAPFPPTSENWDLWMEKLKVSDRYIRAEVLDIVEHNLGYGEEGGNNRGKFIEAIGGKQGAEWCAYVAGYCYERAYERSGFDMPFKRSAGAKGLVKNLAAVGSRYTDIERAEPGDLVGFHRRSGGLLEAIRSWKGHVGILYSKRQTLGGWRVEVAEGNVGGYPAIFRIFTYEIDVDGVWRRLDRGGKKTRCRFWTFATLRKGLK